MKNHYCKLLCKILFHKLQIVHQCSGGVQKLQCTRCQKFFGINHLVKAFLPWDVDLERVCEIVHPQRQHRSLNNIKT